MQLLISKTNNFKIATQQLELLKICHVEIKLTRIYKHDFQMVGNEPLDNQRPCYKTFVKWCELQYSGPRAV